MNSFYIAILLILVASTSFCDSYIPAEIKLNVKYSKNSYWLGDHRLESSVINKLIASASKPPVLKWKFPTNKEKWFKSNSSLALNEFLQRNSFKNATLEQRNLFINAFIGYCTKPIDIDSYWPHPGRDSPATKVSLLLQAKNGTEYHFLSTSLYPFLEPWGIYYKDKSFDTYLPTISALIVGLIPLEQKPDIEKHSALRNHIISAMMSDGLETKWQTLHVKRHLPEIYAALNKSFTVNYLKITSNDWEIFDDDLDEIVLPDFKLSGFEDSRLDVSLGHTIAPENISMFLKVDVKKHKVVGLEKAISKAKAEFKRISSLSLLINYLRDNPEINLTIESSADNIASICSNMRFCRDVRLSSHKFLVPPHGDLFKSSVHFRLTDSNDRLNNSHWLLLSTNQLFLWRYSGKLPCNLPPNLSKHSIVDRHKCVFSVVPIKIFNVTSKNWFGIKNTAPKGSR